VKLRGPAIANSPLIEMNVAGMHLGTYMANSTMTDSIFNYDHWDWLGAERARTNVAGKACRTIASLPFGDGQTITGSCSGAADAGPEHFTGEDRDTESNLDNFGFRYYSSSLGRFMKPDDPLTHWDQGNPQSLNLYDYTLNDPTSSINDDEHDTVKPNFRPRPLTGVSVESSSDSVTV
jgi:RHS repeat-associated protein